MLSWKSRCPLLPDPSDDFLLALSEAGKADYLVTGDKGGCSPSAVTAAHGLVPDFSCPRLFPRIVVVVVIGTARLVVLELLASRLFAVL